MADFQSQVMGLTGLTIDASSTDPSRAEFSTFLNDGVMDVTRRCIELKPQEIDDFIRVSAEQTSNASLDLNGAQIISVVREADVNDDWRKCRKIPPSMQSRVTDVTSLHYASAYNPVYMLENDSNTVDGTISVFPTPGATTKAFKVYYANNSPEETDGSALDHASTGIKYFPSDKIYLVILYAAIKSLECKMAFYVAEEDAELVQAIGPNLTTLQQQYERAFGLMAPPPQQQPQPQQQERRAR